MIKLRSKKAVINISTKMILQIITILYGFLLPKILIGNYGSEVNGLISSITQMLAYISLLESGFGPVLKASLYKPLVKKNKIELASILKTSENFFRIISYIFVIYILILAIGYPILFQSSFSFIYIFSLVIIISISTLFQYYFGMTYRLFLQADQKSYIISILSILTYTVNVVIIFILSLFNFPVHVLMLFLSISSLIRPIYQNYYVKKKYNIDFTIVNKNYEIKNKWDGLAQHVAAVVHDNTDVTLITIFCGLVEVSVYSIYHLVTFGIRNLVFSLAEGIDSSFGNMLAKNEKENLKVKFRMYETVYISICTILYSCTLVLIIPFISIYTMKITDANYIRPLFGFLIVISELIFAVRMPYSTITKAAGHFKETMTGAWVESLTNIVLSIALIFKYGIIGVAVGTIVAMIIRTLEFAYHTNKYIIDDKLRITLIKMLLCSIETWIIVVICSKISLVAYNNYLNFAINGFVIFIISSIITLLVNYIAFNNDFDTLFTMMKAIIRKRSKKKHEKV